MTFSETDLGINSMRGCEGKGRINDQKVTLLFQFFNCWKIALQCCIGFCHTTMWIIVICMYAAAAAKSLQSCPTLCDRIDGGLPGSPVPGILQVRTLEWVAISFSNAWKWKVKGKSLSSVQLFVTPWTTAFQAPLSMGFSRQEYWSGVPLPNYFSLASVIHSLQRCRLVTMEL